MIRLHVLSALVIAATACGGGDAPDGGSSAGDAAPATTASAPGGGGAAVPSGPMTTPDWFHVDHDAQTVHMTITAGSTSDNNYWNFNGAIRGAMAITVPEGYTITIDLVNNDPNMAHSLGISSELSNFTMPPATTPVFEGAITTNPTSMIDATMPGESETIQFVADTAGNYSMVCYIPGHSAVGMWLYFNVSAEGEAGVQGA